jgi:hypothetical protein
MAPSRLYSSSPGNSRLAASPSSFVEDVARRQWESLKKNRPGRSLSRNASLTISLPSPAQAAAELRQRLDETKRERRRSRSRSRDTMESSENSDFNIGRASPTRDSSTKRGGRSSIMAAAERRWDELHSSRDGKRQHRHGRSASPSRGDDSERRETRTESVPDSELPQHIVTLLVQVCGAGGAVQEEAAEQLRDMMHDRETAKLVAQEEWALESLARPLIDGSERSRVACAACFRHLALDGGGSQRILESPLILKAIATALRHGGDATRQKAAAALGNLAWRSEVLEGEAHTQAERETNTHTHTHTHTHFATGQQQQQQQQQQQHIHTHHTHTHT